MLEMNWFKKKEKKTINPINPIDFVITNLDVALRSDYSSLGHFVSLIFIDEKPSFPRVQRTIDQLKINRDIHIVDYHYTYNEITKDTNLHGLEITKH